MRGDPIPSTWLRDCIVAGVAIGALGGIFFALALVLAHFLLLVIAWLRPD